MAKKLKKGDRVEWSSHGGHAEADVAAIAREDGEVSGFEYRASPDDPRYIVETDDGKRAAHKAQTLRKIAGLAGDACSARWISQLRKSIAEHEFAFVVGTPERFRAVGGERNVAAVL